MSKVITEVNNQRRTLVNAAWAAPAVLAVAIPAHAQATATPALCSVIASDSDTTRRNGVSAAIQLQPQIDRTFRMDDYKGAGDLSTLTLDYSFTVSTVFAVVNGSTVDRTEDLTSALTVTLSAPDGSPLGTFTPSQTLSNVTVNAGVTESTDAVEATVTGTIDLLDPALGIDLSSIVRTGDGRVRFDFNATRGSTQFRGADNAGYDVRSPTFFSAEVRINYCGF